MKIDHKDSDFFEIDYVYRIETFEKYLFDTISSDEHYANYKVGLIPNIFYEHNIPLVLSLFRKEFLEVKSGIESYESDNNNDFPMLKSFINTERYLRKILDKNQLEDYTAIVEWSLDNQKMDSKAAAVSRFFLATPILNNYIFQVEKTFGKGILE